MNPTTSLPRRLMGLLIAAPFVIAACSTAVDGTATNDSAAATLATTPAATTEQPEAEAASWLDIELTNAQTGETFTLTSLAGKVVAIEPMAIWCGNCKAQQNNVKSAYADIEASGVTYISLGIDPGEDPAALARYADRGGYAWTFAQSPIEFSRALSDIFGPQILSAPSTPLVVLDTEGQIAFRDFGFHEPDKLLKILEEAA